MTTSTPAAKKQANKMNGASTNGIGKVWMAIAVASLSVNVTGISAWLSFGKDSISRSEVKDQISDAVAKAPFPWKEDRGVVMKHLGESERHETDSQKRSRIREELTIRLKPIEQKIDFLIKQFDEFKGR